MAIENTVYSDFWAAFVNCLERFRLPPIWCELGKNREIISNFEPSLRVGGGGAKVCLNGTIGVKVLPH